MHTPALLHFHASLSLSLSALREAKLLCCYSRHSIQTGIRSYGPKQYQGTRPPPPLLLTLPWLLQQGTVSLTHTHTHTHYTLHYTPNKFVAALLFNCVFFIVGVVLCSIFFCSKTPPHIRKNLDLSCVRLTLMGAEVQYSLLTRTQALPLSFYLLHDQTKPNQTKPNPGPRSFLMIIN